MAGLLGSCACCEIVEGLNGTAWPEYLGSTYGDGAPPCCYILNVSDMNAPAEKRTICNELHWALE